MEIFKKFGSGLTLFLLSILIQSCELVTSVFAREGELTFQVLDQNFDYAAKVMPPELVEQVRRENINNTWTGDPKRFQSVKVQYFGQQYPFYFVYPVIYCPENGCQTQALWDVYHPLCNSFGGCVFFAYIEENPGVYRRVFHQQFWIGTKKNDPLLKVTSQLYLGYPACFELTGYDGAVRERGLPNQKEDQVFVSRYCFNGHNYVRQSFYVIQSKDK